MSSATEPASPAPRAQVVARNSIWMTLDALVGLPVSLVLSILVARSIGPDVLGVYNFANWVLSAGMMVVTYGVTFGMQQFAAERVGQGDIPGATAVLARGLRWQLGMVVVILTVGIALTAGALPAGVPTGTDHRGAQYLPPRFSCPYPRLASAPPRLTPRT